MEIASDSTKFSMAFSMTSPGFDNIRLLDLPANQYSIAFHRALQTKTSSASHWRGGGVRRTPNSE